MIQINPFVTVGYKGSEYFCDRAEETKMLVRNLTNQCNVALISPRRLGKSGLIRHCFSQEEIKDKYYTFFVDIYETKNLEEFIFALGKTVLDTLKGYGTKAWESFLSELQSLQHSFTFNAQGLPVWNVSIGELRTPEVTLDEIFQYLANADRPCLVAIDEFQTILDYPEKKVEAMLRTRIQSCNNATFVFSGSKRHMMTEMFVTPSHPFYQSAPVMGLSPLNPDVYYSFASYHLAKGSKSVTREAFIYLYDRFEGVTWFIQYVLNVLYTTSEAGTVFEKKDVDVALSQILDQQDYAYRTLIFQLPSKQKQVLTAIASDGKVQSIMSNAFLRRHQLTASTVQGAVKVLLARDFITCDDGSYCLCDKFLQLWLNR